MPSYRLYLVNILAFVPIALVSTLRLLHFSNYMEFILWGVIMTVCSAAWYFGINVIFFRSRVKSVLALLRRK